MDGRFGLRGSGEAVGRRPRRTAAQGGGDGRPRGGPVAAGGSAAHPGRTIEEQFILAEVALADLRDSKALKLATIGGFFIFLVPIAILAAVPSLFVDEKVLAVVGGAAGALGLSFLLHWLVRRSALS